MDQRWESEGAEDGLDQEQQRKSFQKTKISHVFVSSQDKMDKMLKTRPFNGLIPGWGNDCDEVRSGDMTNKLR